jgi:hypothetical protein
LETMFSFSATVLSNRFNQIRSLCIYWRLQFPLYQFPDRPSLYGNLPYPCDEDTWERFWGLIAGMQGLRYLSLAIRTRSGALDDRRSREYILKPLREVCQVSYFLVQVPWTVEDVAGIEPGKFQLINLVTREALWAPTQLLQA